MYLPSTPANYKCSECLADGVKLWRGYSEMVVNLLCGHCAAIKHKRDISTMDAKGFHLVKTLPTDAEPEPTQTISWEVPAVPIRDIEGGYWGYSSVPSEAADWWEALPSLPTSDYLISPKSKTDFKRYGAEIGQQCGAIFLERYNFSMSDHLKIIKEIAIEHGIPWDPDAPYPLMPIRMQIWESLNLGYTFAREA